MLITDTRQKPNTTFGTLNYGDVFEDEDNDICIKMDNDYSAANAVVLTTGQAFCSNSDTPVTLLNAELVVKGER